MVASRTHASRKPVGSGSAVRPAPEYSPPLGQITSNPYVNASPATPTPPRTQAPAPAAAGGTAFSYMPRHASPDSVHSAQFFDSPQHPRRSDAVNEPARSQTSAPAQLMPQSRTHSYASHRSDASRSSANGYQKLSSDTPEPLKPEKPGLSFAKPRSFAYAANGSYPTSDVPTTPIESLTGRSLTDSPGQSSNRSSNRSENRSGDLSGDLSRDQDSSDEEFQDTMFEPARPPVPPHTSLPHASFAHSSDPHLAAQATYAQPGRTPEVQPFTQYANPFVDGFQGNQFGGQLGGQLGGHLSGHFGGAGLETNPFAAPDFDRPPAQSDPPPYNVFDQGGASSQPELFRFAADAYSGPPRPRIDSEQSVSPTHSLSTSTDTQPGPQVFPPGPELAPGELYHKQLGSTSSATGAGPAGSAGARGPRVSPLTLSSLAHGNSSSDLSPRGSAPQFDTPTSTTSASAYGPYSATPSTDSPTSEQPHDAVRSANRSSATSLGAHSQMSRASRPVRGTPPAVPVGVPVVDAKSISDAKSDSDVKSGSAKSDATKGKKSKDESLGIGVGSAYVQRIRVEAAETHISKLPAVLPIGIRSRGKSATASVQPEFLRKAMDIRYTHLPQRMLETEVEDDDLPLGQQQFPGAAHPARPQTPAYSQTGPSRSSPESSFEPVRRPSSPVESVIERTGKIKLFVANPDEDSD